MCSCPEIATAIAAGRLHPDGEVLLKNGAALVTKAAIEPVWFLPGVAARFGCTETALRRVLFEETGGMYPELVTRGDLEVFLPPIGGQTLYIFGAPRDLADPTVELTARVHDECNGSDRFRLRHLHLQALSHARDRGVHRRGRSAEAWGWSHIRARKAAHSAR